MTDRERLQALYTSQPENDDQRLRKVKLIHELERQLGLIKPDESALVVNGDLDDVQGFGGR
jgi:hypothetical protein